MPAATRLEESLDFDDNSVVMVMTMTAYMQKTSDAGDIITANFLDFPPNLGIFRSFQVILGHF